MHVTLPSLSSRVSLVFSPWVPLSGWAVLRFSRFRGFVCGGWFFLPSVTLGKSAEEERNKPDPLPEDSYRNFTVMQSYRKSSW